MIPQFKLSLFLLLCVQLASNLDLHWRGVVCVEAGLYTIYHSDQIPLHCRIVSVVLTVTSGH
jgi:hypothetical protein